MLPRKISQLIDAVQEQAKSGPANLSDLFRSFTFDIQCVVFFGKDDNLLGSDDRGQAQHQLTRELFRQWDLVREFPSLTFFKTRAPACISHRISPILRYEKVTSSSVRIVE